MCSVVAGLIPDHILDQIRQNNDVVDVIGSYFPLKRAGANFRALCPFHKEKTPSFNVNPQKQIWHCFGCGAGGDVFGFVMKYENLEFVAAVRRLAERAGIRIEWEEAAGEPGRSEKDLLLKLHEDAAAFFHDYLLKHAAATVARDYLKKRKIGLDTAKKWRLGYAPDSWDALIQWAATKKFSTALLESAGLALRSERAEGESRLYDRFRGRLMFPICDEQSRVVAFSGRILTDAKNQPKYVNSPETAIFQKGKILFALDKAKRAILDEKYAIVCEGQLDTISCHESGLANVVAPQGTALTEQHARILKRYTDEAVLMFDADEAGQNAAVRSAESLLAAGLIIRVATLPQSHDPDSFVKTFGVEELKKLVTNSPSFLVYLLERFSSQYDRKTDRGKLRIAQNMVPFLSMIPNAVLRSTYIRQTAARLDVPEDALLEELRKLRRRQPVATASEAMADKKTADAASESSPAEKTLLQLMLADEQIVRLTDERLDRAWLSDSVAGELIRRSLKMYRANRWAGAGGLLADVQDETGGRLISQLALSRQLQEKLDGAAQDCLARLERQWVERSCRQLRNRLAQAGLSMSEVAQLQQQVLDLRRKLDNIAPLSMAKAKAAPR